MAVFKNTADEWLRLDWQILQNGWISLYWQQRVLDKDLDWFKKEKYSIVDLDATAWVEDTRMHKALKKQLNFPDHYGENLNALNDCLADLIIHETGLVIVFRQFQQVHQEIAHKLLDIFASNARRHSLFGKRLLVLIQVDNPKYHIEPIGASSVLWNPIEWLDSNRNL